jgi:TolA-binding protein
MALARGRVASVDEHGARVLLEDGSAHVEVVRRPGARWMFDAGPFLVNVHGTEFDLGWKAAEGQLDVRLHRGAVSVTGPVSDQGISLHAGQWLTVRLATHEVFVRNLDQAAPPAPAPAQTPEPAIAPSAPASPEPVPALPGTAVKVRHHSARTSGSRPDDLDWAAARSAGEWTRILDGAVRRGVDRTLAERSSEDLALLADAAHYLHRDDVAERALLAQRKRFPGSTRAKDAAFLLGRIVEARPGSASAALAWYDRHLEEAPSGVYASEALGRKMTVLGRLGGEQAARPVAEEYLRRYPAGSYARAARAYARTP